MPHENFRVIEDKKMDQLPKEVLVWFYEHKRKKGLFVYTWQEQHYLLIALGMRPNPGYRLELIKVEGDEKETDVFVEERHPEKDKFYPQVVVYPYILAEVRGSIRVWMIQSDRQILRFG
ncbi:protease complex subunit PrcB family protein [Thermoflavimicrobium dichotomicum]|uniref:PrcB C-terminal n=1 Tax=Thermoflavimicrobium dichotomicum TaxID=46223 RepID=A0A1I3QE98_9BACL|nr:protease complex subunit PrcB family protein [Thermoflavimicrobium dichotomicum]SFJ31862.1 PrcB C-terminal [Thermoflavimicrobium dichotomicum]